MPCSVARATNLADNCLVWLALRLTRCLLSVTGWLLMLCSLPVIALPCAVLEAWTGAPAYDGQSGAAIFFAVVHQGERPQLPADMPPSYASLVRDCWRQLPQDRPDIQAVLARLKEVRAAMAGATAGADASAAENV